MFTRYDTNWIFLNDSDFHEDEYPEVKQLHMQKVMMIKLNVFFRFNMVICLKIIMMSGIKWAMLLKNDVIVKPFTIKNF